MTSIQEWQIEKGFTTHPLYNMWVNILFNGCLEKMDWINNFNSIQSEEDKWRTFYKDLHNTIPTDIQFLHNIPNQQIKELWIYKSSIIQSFMIKFYNIIQIVSIDPLINDVYREKTEQALNFLSGSIDYIPLFLQNHHDSTDLVYATQEANNIIEKRQKWVTVMARLDYTRRSYVAKVMEIDKMVPLRELTQKTIDSLDEMYKKWI